MEWQTSARCYSAALIALIPDKMIRMSSGAEQGEQPGRQRRPFRKVEQVRVRRCFNKRMSMMGSSINKVIPTIG